MTTTLQCGVSDGIGSIALNRPEVLNAINAEMHNGLRRALQDMNADDCVRVIVVSGNGRAFSAGGDLRAGEAEARMGRPVDLGMDIWDSPKPVIAAVHGYCLGQAGELAAVCDLTVAAAGTLFGEVEINHGWGPPVLSTPFTVGLKAAKEVLLLGEMYDADAALAMGIVNRVVAEERLESVVAAMAARIANLAPDVVARNKQLVNQVYERQGFREALAAASRG